MPTAGCEHPRRQGSNRLPRQRLGDGRAAAPTLPGALPGSDPQPAGRRFFSVACPVGGVRGEPHQGVFDCETRALTCEECSFSAGPRAAASIFTVTDRLQLLERLFAELERTDPGRAREALRRAG